MAAQPWQHTNVNFSDVNGAMATASASFGQAGALAKGLVDSINQTAKVKDDKARTAYLVDTAKRNREVEQDNFDLGIRRQANNAKISSEILQGQVDESKAAQLALMQEAFNKQKAYTPAVNADGSPMVMSEAVSNLPTLKGADGNPISTPTNQDIGLAAPTELPSDYNQGFDREQFINNTYNKLIGTGRFDSATSMAMAQQEANTQLGTLASAGQIRDKQAVLKTQYEEQAKIIKAAIDANKPTSGNTVNNMLGGSSRSGGTSGYSNQTYKLDVTKADAWIKTLPEDKAFWGTLLGTAWDKDTQVNQNKLKGIMSRYMALGVTQEQFVSYMNNQIKDSKTTGKYMNEKFESTDKNTMGVIANEMAKYGADSTTIKSSNGLAGANIKLKLNKLQSQNAEVLYNKMQELTKAYSRDYTAAAAAGAPLTGKQKADNYYKRQRMLNAEILKVTEKPKYGDGSKNTSLVKLFTDKSNPISKAWNTKDAKGTSSLVNLMLNNPKEYASSLAKLTNEEKIKLAKFTKSKKYLDILKAKSKIKSKVVTEKPVVHTPTTHNTSEVSKNGSSFSYKPTSTASNLYEVYKAGRRLFRSDKTPTSAAEAQQQYLLYR